MAGHGLGRADSHAVSRLAECRLDGLRFVLVVQLRRRAMRADVINLLRVEAGVSQGQRDGAGGARAPLSRGSDVMRIGCLPVAGDLAQNRRAARTGMFQTFHDEKRSAFAHDQSIALAVEGARRPRLQAAGRTSLLEAAQGHVGQDGFCSTRQYRIQLATANGAEGMTDGIATGGTGRGDRRAGPLDAEVNRQHAGGAVGHDHGDRKWAQPVQPPRDSQLLLVYQRANAADAGADGNANTLAIGVRNLQLCLSHRLTRGDCGELLVAVAAPRIAPAKVLFGIKILDLAQPASRMIALVEEGKRTKARTPGQNGCPRIGDVVAQRRYHAHARYDDPVLVILHIVSPLRPIFRRVRSRYSRPGQRR